MAKQNRRAWRPAARASQNYLSLLVALVIFLCLSVGAGFVFAFYQLEFSGRLTVIVFLIVFPTVAVCVAVWLILQNIRRISARENSHSVDWQMMPPENQRRKLNIEIEELARALATTTDQLSDLQMAYIVAEDLAFRKIEQEAQIPLARHIALDTVEYDAVLFDEDVIKCIETIFLVSANIRREKFDVILRKIDLTREILAQTKPGTKLVLLLALVTQFDRAEESKLRSTLADKFAATPVDVDIRFFDFENLQRIFVEE